MGVTAVQLAGRLGVHPKALRSWLRVQAANGHPLLVGHGSGSGWIFSEADAEVLLVDFASRSPTARLSRPRDAELGSPTGGGDGASAGEVANALLASPVPAQLLMTCRAPDRPGLYAWWHAPGLLTDVSHPPGGPTLAADGLLKLAYVGIGGSLDERLRERHLGARTGSSTLRRALGAWLGSDLGLKTVLTTDRVQHTIQSEAILTAWMLQNLHVSFVKHPNPAEVEAEVIRILRPPLNVTHNARHPNHAKIREARARWRASAAASGSS